MQKIKINTIELLIRIIELLIILMQTINTTLTTPNLKRSNYPSYYSQN